MVSSGLFPYDDPPYQGAMSHYPQPFQRVASRLGHGEVQRGSLPEKGLIYSGWPRIEFENMK